MRCSLNQQIQYEHGSGLNSRRHRPNFWRQASNHWQAKIWVCLCLFNSLKLGMLTCRSSKDLFIAVMGVTGSGKSTFISRCTSTKVEVGHGLRSRIMPYEPQVRSIANGKQILRQSKYFLVPMAIGQSISLIHQGSTIPIAEISMC